MSDRDKTSNKERVREALRTLANARARKTALRHRVENAGDVARARAHATSANIQLGAAEARRDVQKRVDEARVDATRRKK